MFRTPAQKWHKEIITEVDKGKQASVMVWAAIFGNAERSKLVIMDRDFESKKNGYSAASYIATLEIGLLPITQNDERDFIFMQDNAPIHTARKATR